jgi:hypothetical protein
MLCCPCANLVASFTASQPTTPPTTIQPVNESRSLSYGDRSFTGLWMRTGSCTPTPIYLRHCSEHTLIHGRCLAHVVNLAVIVVMSHITKIAAIESSNAIWEYDPSLPGNRVLSGSLDVISAIQTLAIKVSHPLMHFHSLFMFCTRSRLRGNGLNILSGYKFNVVLLRH